MPTLLWFVSNGLAAQTHTWAVPIDHLELRNAAGDVHVDVGAERVEVELHPVRDVGCEIDVGERDGHAFVEIRGRAAGAECQVNVLVRLPAEGTAQVSLGAGTVHGRLGGAATVNVGAGDIVLGSLRAPVAAKVGAGTVRLGFDVAPTGRIDVATGVGEVDVDLPDDAPVDLDGTGTRHVALRVDEAAPTVVAARTGLGSVRVH